MEKDQKLIIKNTFLFVIRIILLITMNCQYLQITENNINSRIYQFSIILTKILQMDIKMSTQFIKQASLTMMSRIVTKKYSIQSFKSLIQLGADVNFQDKKQIKQCQRAFQSRRKQPRFRTYTPLSLAVLCLYKNQSYKVNLIELLLQNGGNWKLTNPPKKQSQYCFKLCEVVNRMKRFRCQSQKLRLINVLFKYGIEEMQQKGCKTHLLLAIMDGFGIKDKSDAISHFMNQFCPKYKFYFEDDNNRLFEQKNIYEGSSQFRPFTKVLLDLVKGSQTKTAQEKNKQIKLIKNIINLGINPNQSRSCYRYTPSEQKYNYIFETVLHRCIMNNEVELVQFLIDKGANVDQMCRLEVYVPVFAHQWSKKQKQGKEEQHYHLIRILERKKIGYIERGQKDKIIDLQRQIQQARCFFVQNSAPKYTITQKQYTCLQLAEQFGADDKILNLLTMKMNKQDNR